MNRKLSDLASIAEIISGVAVVVTLVFLVLGIRENTEITRAQMFDSNMDSVGEFRSLIISDSEVANIWEAFQNEEYDNLQRSDQARLRQLVWLAIGNYEKAYYARQYGVLGDEEWGRSEVQTCIQYRRLIRIPEMAERVDLITTSEFSSYMATSCQ